MFPKQVFTSQVMANNTSLLVLPPEILAIIFSTLNLSDMRSLMLTCKALRDLIRHDNIIWRLVSQQTLIVHNSLGNSKQISLAWSDQCRVAYNWCKGIYKSKVLIHLNTNFMPWIKFHNSESLLVSVGSELRCYNIVTKGLPNCRDTSWKLEVPKFIRHDVRTNDISRFVMKDDLIVCGNRDGCVAVIKLDNCGKKPRLYSHILDCHANGLVEVTAVELINKNSSSRLVITGSNYCPEFRFWDIDEDNAHQIFKGSVTAITIPGERGVRCFSVDPTCNRLAVGLNGNSRPILYDLPTGRLLMTADTTRNIRHAVRDIQWHNNNEVIYVTHSGRLQFVDTRTQHVVYDVMDPFQSSLYCVKSDGHRTVIAGSSEYSRCVLFDARNTKHHKQIYFTQKKRSPVYCLDFESTRLITAADKSIAVLNFDISTSSVAQRDYSYIFDVVNG